MADFDDMPILILAAGRSSRMRGVDKLAQTVDGEPLLRRQARLSLGLSRAVFVALPPDAAAREALLDGLAITILTIDAAAEGMSASLRGGVAALPECERFMVLLGDLPLLDAADLRSVAVAASSVPALIWRGATEAAQPGHPIVFDASLRDRFRTITGDGGGESLVKPLRDRTHLVPLPGSHARYDLDTPEEWAAFRAETGR